MKPERKKSVTRREFIKTSTAAAAATMGGTWLAMSPKSAWADKKTNSVIIGMTQETTQFNPLFYNNSGTDEIPESCMFDALWDIGPDGKFYPNLAVRVPTMENGGISPDGLTWKIELKKGVKWQDGAPFTAADVDFTYQTIINPNFMVRTRTGFDRIKDFRVVDDFHVEFKLDEPFVPLIWSWQQMHIVPKHVLSKVKDMNTCEWNTQGTFGTGPFKLVKRVAGSHMMYRANPEYHRGPPKLKTVIHKFVPDQTVLYTQMKTGEIDVMGLHGIPPERYTEAKKIPGRDILLTPSPWTESLLFNCSKPFFQDKRVRQALYLAVDKDKWVNDIYYGTVKRTLSYLSPTHWAYNQNLKDPGYNPQKAAEMLDASGWKKGSDGIREKDGLKLAFSISTTAGAKVREQAEVMVQQNFKDIGVALEIKNFIPSVMWGKYFTEVKYDTCIVGYEPPLGMDPDYTQRIHSKANVLKHPMGGGYTGFDGNPEMDRLLEEGVRVSDQAKRKEIYDKFQELFLDECVFGPIFSVQFVYSKKSGLEGYNINPYTTDIATNIYDWYWA